MKIAADYFEEFEGWHLYPGLKNKYFLFTVAAGFFWLLSIWWFLASAVEKESLVWQTLAVLGFQMSWMLLLDELKKLKNTEVLRLSVNKYQQSFNSIDDCKSFVLTRVLRLEQAKFLAVAKECQDLLSLKKAFKVRPEWSMNFLWRKIYDPESKARLLGIVLASISVLAALTVRSIPVEIDVFEILSDRMIQSLILFLVLAAALAYFVLVGVLAALQFLVEGATMWFVRLGIDKGKHLTPLYYFIGDLVQLHVHATTVPVKIRTF
ncbi:hypothetical protein [Polaromonas sp. JS666]|uniref:hypothetical protein n=1 Tax=Polaromonas sp. (strain JS666 / ATCC BAA-500) TaxID=296591 RepID=UPI0011142106|nr:hypothetical protein [Polaromonas sp. JS666]